MRIGGCVWFEHSDRTKYLHVCVRRAFESEAEVTTEWRLHDRLSKQGRSIEPERLSHHLTECDVVSRGEISFLVRDLDDGHVTIVQI